MTPYALIAYSYNCAPTDVITPCDGIGTLPCCASCPNVDHCITIQFGKRMMNSSPHPPLDGHITRVVSPRASEEVIWIEARAVRDVSGGIKTVAAMQNGQLWIWHDRQSLRDETMNELRMSVAGDIAVPVPVEMSVEHPASAFWINMKVQQDSLEWATATSKHATCMRAVAPQANCKFPWRRGKDTFTIGAWLGRGTMMGHRDFSSRCRAPGGRQSRAGACCI